MGEKEKCPYCGADMPCDVECERGEAGGGYFIHEPDVRLTQKERAAIRTLARLAKGWPKRLWLFAADGELCVMRNDVHGRRRETATGGVDPESLVGKVFGIEVDGGGW